MTSLSQTDLENLQADSNSLTTSAFVGVLVGHGSMILHFSNGSSVLVQCEFEVFDGKLSRPGHGESAATSLILFEFFNEHVVSVSVDVVGQMTFSFGANRGFRIIPAGSGFESYVLQTQNGVFPVY
jgi:hypothetical protein